MDILTATSFPQIIFPENEAHEIQFHITRFKQYIYFCRQL